MCRVDGSTMQFKAEPNFISDAEHGVWNSIRHELEARRGGWEVDELRRENGHTSGKLPFHLKKKWYLFLQFSGKPENFIER